MYGAPHLGESNESLSPLAPTHTFAVAVEELENPGIRSEIHERSQSSLQFGEWCYGCWLYQ